MQFNLIRCCLFLVLFISKLSAGDNSGIVIILTGPSAAGKSSIQNEIQKQSDALFLKVGIDTFFDALLPEPDLTSFEEKKEFKQYAPDHTLIEAFS